MVENDRYIEEDNKCLEKISLESREEAILAEREKAALQDLTNIP